MAVKEHGLAAQSQAIDPVRLGRSIRNARIAAGLTQTELGGEEASAAYISRIESGQRRPGFRLLQVVAERTSTSVEDLLGDVPSEQDAELRLELDYGELALRSGNASDALDHVSNVLTRVDKGTDPVLERSARLIEALALESLGRVDDAILALEHFLEADKRDVEWMKAAIALTRCYREAGEFQRAITTGEDALKQIRALGTDGTDEAVQLTVTVASAYHEAGDVRHAVRICREAVTKAEDVGSARAKASAYWNASIMESDAGEVSSAISLAEHAIALLERDEDMRSLSRLQSQLGMFLLRAQPPEVDAARTHLEAARRELDWSQASPIEKAYNDLYLARAHVLVGEHEQATALLSTTLDAAQHAPVLAADCLTLLGQVDLQRGDLAAAREHYQRAILLLTAASADRSVAQRWLELGSLLDQAGLSDEARDAYRRAAVSTGLTDPSISLPSHASSHV